MSQLQDKSNTLQDAADLLHQEGLYPAVAHSAYYSCLQLSKHLWLHKMGKTEGDLDAECSSQKKGSHGILINAARNYIKNSALDNCNNDSRNFSNQIGQLKTLRIEADYGDTAFSESNSSKSISLSKTIIPVLKKYTL